MVNENNREIFEPRTETGSEHFAYKGIGVSQIFKLIISTKEEILNNFNVVVWSQVKWECNSFPVAIRRSKTSRACTWFGTNKKRYGYQAQSDGS